THRPAEFVHKCITFGPECGRSVRARYTARQIVDIFGDHRRVSVEIARNAWPGLAVLRRPKEPWQLARRRLQLWQDDKRAAVSFTEFDCCTVDFTFTRKVAYSISAYSSSRAVGR